MWAVKIVSFDPNILCNCDAADETGKHDIHQKKKIRISHKNKIKRRRTLRPANIPQHQCAIALR